MADERPGRRRRRTIAAEANPVVVHELPPGHNILTQEEHEIYALMENQNMEELPMERKIPPNAPEIEKKIYRFTKAQRTRNERENVHNFVLNEVFNAIGDIRAEFLNLEDKPSTKEIRKALKRCTAQHSQLLEKAHVQAEKVREVGGTPLGIPDHFEELPSLTN